MSFEGIPRLVERLRMWLSDLPRFNADQPTLTSQYSAARLLEKICPCGFATSRIEALSGPSVDCFLYPNKSAPHFTAVHFARVALRTIPLCCWRIGGSRHDLVAHQAPNLEYPFCSLVFAKSRTLIPGVLRR